MIKNIIIAVLVLALGVLFISTLNQKEPSLPSDKDTLKQSETITENNKSDEVKVDSNKSIDLSGTGLQKLPSEVLFRNSLEELDISDNNLTGALPSEIGKLKKLKVLNASNNRMTGVPAEVGQLENLEILNLSNNELTGLPNELGNLKKLKVLDLSGNDYAKQDLEKIKEGLSSNTEIIL